MFMYIYSQTQTCISKGMHKYKLTHIPNSENGT